MRFLVEPRGFAVRSMRAMKAGIRLWPRQTASESHLYNTRLRFSSQFSRSTHFTSWFGGATALPASPFLLVDPDWLVGDDGEISD